LIGTIFFSLLSDQRASVASLHSLLDSFSVLPLAASVIILDPPENLADLLTSAVADYLLPFSLKMKRQTTVTKPLWTTMESWQSNGS
jgi:hypothetical protein